MHPYALTLFDRYARLLRAAATMPAEERVRVAGAFGGTCLSAGLGVQDVAVMHERALVDALDDTDEPHAVRALLTSGAPLLAEILVAFDGADRGSPALRTARSRRHQLMTDIADVVDYADDVVFAADLDGRIVSINAAGAALTGYPVDVLRRMTLTQLLASGHLGATDRLRALRRIRRASSGQTVHHEVEVEVIDRDGRALPLAVHVRAVTEHGRAVGIQGIARDITVPRQAQAGLRSLHERLEQKVQAIARALHDEAGQLLVSVYLQLDALGAELPENTGLQQHVVKLRSRLDEVTEELRRLAHELRPTILDDLGLDSACQVLADGVARRAGIAITVRGSVGGRLSPDVETAVYRVIQEALTNAVRHGRPRVIAIDFDRRLTSVRGRIRDDGAGFDVSAVLSRTGQRGLGLMGMRERLAAVGGEFAIRSSAEMGTSIVFDVPVESRDVHLSASG